jgi:hypothetical protein
VAASVRRSAQPSWPSAMTCFFFSSFKTLLTLTEGNSSRQSQCPDYFLIGRFWVTAEEPGLDRVRAKGKSGFKCGWACKVLCLITNTGTLRRHSLRASRPWIFKSSRRVFAGGGRVAKGTNKRSVQKHGRSARLIVLNVRSSGKTEVRSAFAGTPLSDRKVIPGRRNNARAGTFAELVKAAEGCPAKCIHPGTPRPDDATATRRVRARAAKFQ